MPLRPFPRRALLLGGASLALASPARHAGAEPDLAVVPAAGYPQRGPGVAEGAIVWLHGGYWQAPPNDPPPMLARMAQAGWDMHRQDRPGMGRDPLAPAAEALFAGTQGLRAAGYRQVVLVGESRGAFVALVALRYPRLADAAAFLAPAAHGPRPERRPLALAAWRVALAGMDPAALRRASLVLFEGDPYDPDPAARIEAFHAAMAAHRIPDLIIDRPASPRGHGGGADPEFDPSFGACLTGFLAGDTAAACAPR